MEKDNVVFPQNLYTYLGAEAKQRILFLYSRQDLKPITTNIQGFSAPGIAYVCRIRIRRGRGRKPPYRNQEHFKLSSPIWSPLHYVKRFSPPEVIPPSILSEMIESYAGVSQTWPDLARPWDNRKYKEPILRSNAT